MSCLYPGFLGFSFPSFFVISLHFFYSFIRNFQKFFRKNSNVSVSASVILFFDLFLLGTASALSGTSDASNRWGPWSKDSRNPVIPESAVSRAIFSNSSKREKFSQWEKKDFGKNGKNLPGPSLFQFPLLWSITFYQKIISPADGARCGLYPNCSAYARLAVQKHGMVLGFIMAAERVMRSHNEVDYCPAIQKFGRIFLYDPVEANDFWFSSQRKQESQREQEREP